MYLCLWNLCLCLFIILRTKVLLGDNDTRISLLTTAQRVLGPSTDGSAIGALPSVSLSLPSVSVSLPSVSVWANCVCVSAFQCFVHSVPQCELFHLYQWHVPTCPESWAGLIIPVPQIIEKVIKIIEKVIKIIEKVSCWTEESSIQGSSFWLP